MAPLDPAAVFTPQGWGTANNNPSETDRDSLRLLMMNNLCLMASGNSGCFWVLELLKDLCWSLWARVRQHFIPYKAAMYSDLWSYDRLRQACLALG